MELTDVMYLSVFFFGILVLAVYLMYDRTKETEKRLMSEKRKRERGDGEVDPEELDAEIEELKRRKAELEKENIEGKKLKIERLKNEISTLERKTG